jgi:hypothetical protein
MWAKPEVEGAELMRSQLNVSFNKLHSSWQELKDSTREYSRTRTQAQGTCLI